MTRIQNVKSSFRKLHFTPNGSRLAVVVSNEGQDSIEIYKTDVWKLSKVSNQIKSKATVKIR